MILRSFVCYKWFDTVDVCVIMNKTNIGILMKKIYMDHVHKLISEDDRDKRLISIIEAYSDIIIENDMVCKTIKQIIGQKRSTHLMSLIDKGS